MTEFHTDDVQTVERISADQNDDSETRESVTMMNSPRATATKTFTTGTNDHRHEWARKAAATSVVPSLPTTIVLRKPMMMMMTTMRTGS